MLHLVFNPCPLLPGELSNFSSNLLNAILVASWQICERRLESCCEKKIESDENRAGWISTLSFSSCQNSNIPALNFPSPFGTWTVGMQTENYSLLSGQQTSLWGEIAVEKDMKDRNRIKTCPERSEEKRSEKCDSGDVRGTEPWRRAKFAGAVSVTVFTLTLRELL